MATVTKDELATLQNTNGDTASTEETTYIGHFIGDLTGQATTAKELEKPYRLTLNGDVSGYADINASDTNLTVKVNEATHAAVADFAGKVDLASRSTLADLANLATYAIKSGKATETEHATKADTATTAETATHADNATNSVNAEYALIAEQARKDMDGKAIVDTYAKIADRVDTATVSGKAVGSGTRDGNELKINITSLSSVLGEALVFSALPESGADTTKLYADLDKGCLWAYDATAQEWKNTILAAAQAKTLANNAVATANSANDTASAAKTAADNAVTTADGANTTATTAKDTADSATEIANQAKTKADSATEIANQAKTKADSATEISTAAKEASDNAVAEFTSKYKAATADDLGLVKPDAKTILITSEGVISCNSDTYVTKASLIALLPAGVIIPFAGTSVPAGYLLCNGAAVSRTTYASLFAAIGTLYGTGNGSTTFNLPDARGRVLQGASGTHSTGSYISAGLPNITGSRIMEHDCIGNSWQGALSNAYLGKYNTTIAIPANQFAVERYLYSFNASKSNAVYGANATVQMPAAAIQYLIKY